MLTNEYYGYLRLRLKVRGPQEVEAVFASNSEMHIKV